MPASQHCPVLPAVNMRGYCTQGIIHLRSHSSLGSWPGWLFTSSLMRVSLPSHRVCNRVTRGVPSSGLFECSVMLADLRSVTVATVEDASAVECCGSGSCSGVSGGADGGVDSLIEYTEYCHISLPALFILPLGLLLVIPAKLWSLSCIGLATACCSPLCFLPPFSWLGKPQHIILCITDFYLRSLFCFTPACSSLSDSN